MDVSKYIAEFLKNKGYVILPGLGSFLSTYQSARFSDDQKTLLPPSRTYSFNPDKKQPDNTLALFIAGKENTPVSVAQKEVEEYVEGCHYVINKGKRLEIKEVGLLFRDEQGKICFELDPNMVTEGDYYGLPEVKVRPAGKATKNVYNRVKVIMVILTVLALIGAGFYAGVFKTFLWERLFSPAPVPDTALVQPRSSDTLSSDSLTTQAQSTQATDTLSESSVSQKEGQTPVEDVSLSPAAEQYYVVAGCFRSEEGAQKTVKQLKDKGFNARIFGKSKQGLNMVCYASFETKEEAKKFLAKIVAETDSKAWLTKY